MSEDKKAVQRLFKVAKELNVGTSTLVDFLREKGITVKDAPTEKLSGEMYDLLIKEFASEKTLKEKAEQVKEKKREAAGVGEESHPEEEPILSAAQLRVEILEKPVEEEKKVDTNPKLKVLGKIDLSTIGKGQKKTEEKPAEKPKPPTVQVEKVIEKAAVEAPEVKPEPKPKLEESGTKEVKVKSKKPEQVEVPEVHAEKVASTTPENEIIRHSAPRLSGLKVLGKIVLPTAKTSSPKESSEDAAKRKRKRRRKPGGAAPKPGGDAANAPKKEQRKSGPPPKDDRKKKEEITDKEIQDKIKTTLAELQKKADRSRQRLRREKRDQGAARRQEAEIQRQEDSRIIEVTEFISANELANQLNVPITEIISKCLSIGLFISINQRLEADVISLLAEEYGYAVRFIDVKDTELTYEEDDSEPDEDERPPIITVMGHVDHGKTSLLDFVRKANVIAGEAGGITQHIGAYEVRLADGRNITFLDTPGHEAFTAMRARGAKVTDVAIIVIAADDSVMPQTREAINHAQAAGVKMVFAINKIDKAGATPEKIKEQLSAMNILVEDWGGSFQCQEISAKSGIGVTELLDKVLLEAEILGLKANAKKVARGTVIEAKLDKGRGITATLLVQNGTLNIGDTLVAGVHYGKIKALMDERGKRIEFAGPSTPVQVLGLSDFPQAGDKFLVYATEKEAKEIATRRSELFRQQALRQHKRISLDEIARRKAKGEFKELNLIVKGDVDGSVEALSDSLLKLSTDEVSVNIVMKAVGQITESDVLLATASDAVMVGFQVRPSTGARKLAETEGVDIRLYSIIYDAINDVKDALAGLLSPEIKEEYMGSAQVREVFKVSKVGTIAGCMITDGKMFRNDPIRLIRDGIVIYQGKLHSLKRFKDDVKEVKEGFECGIGIDNYQDLQTGDIIESYKQSEVARTL